ncbi:16S rRNA (cytosine967-C5)-methyltransferase [Endobacter medicaginis]|uniref:16S rRNA (Cytosine967-C5)-methyltransferase n=1 Tax=Endobacter medicaginis TaxID=1181271 RepID=A0A839UWD6_9PROT|nr:RsmB/NOP family class I SAM-dependent RNA methyltransferase [Endobacter medicaginis]MBB3174106.1 16S rRNA (cytosine967-C5)-methyltransferase [Endobacter medicaginis]MCX5474150.1 RsmB/NOP family class I SAM-dependent RNA methyltransferase [Endobacter medicaginis]NVN29235.1 RsmB/NOP family class I SAM-dependent RNA methyltransferase [Endobacter medicaginis]
MTPAARTAAAIDLLDEIEGQPRKPADAVANAFFRDRRYIGSTDRREISALVWSVLRARRRLDWWLAQGSAARDFISPRLLVAAHQMLDGRPLDSVARGFSGGRYAPAELDAEELRRLRPLDGHTLDHPGMPLAVRHEIPDWIVPNLTARFGPALESELAALAAPAPLDLRVNLLKATRDDARTALARDGITAEPTSLSPWGLRVSGRQAVTSAAAFRDGLVEIQDEGSQLLVGLVEATPEMRVVDYCAGAGGKTLALAMTMQNRGQIVACDVSAPRLEGAVKRLRRAGVHNVERHLLEPGDKWAKRRAGSFDRVLVDAPCTGTGTWRRNPDARLRLRPEDLAELTVKQSQILDTAARLVKPGGKLIYGTCSLLAEENDAQIDAFLTRTQGFTLMRTLSLTPHANGTDGFFGAVLQRQASSPDPDPADQP